jgi:hypothetical protein
MAGVKFSYKFPKLKVINNREQFLKEYVAGKSVLHGGCVDSDLLEERKESQLFLHDILGQSAGKLVGVDVDRQGIEKMLQLGYRDVFYADLESWDYPGKFDVIVLGEIIEHIDNCGDFLHSVRKFCGPDTEVIFTTPNNYYFLFWLYTLAGKESIHPDHNYLFSFHSIKSLLGKFGFRVRENIVLWNKVDFTRVDDTRSKRLKKRIAAFFVNGFQLLRYFAPQYGKGIIIIAVPET